MRITTTQPLFAWEALEDSPTLQTLREFLAAIPNAKLLDSLRQWRGKGRDDYPVSVLWGTLVPARATRREGTLGKMKLSAVAKALRAKLRG